MEGAEVGITIGAFGGGKAKTWIQLHSVSDASRGGVRGRVERVQAPLDMQTR